MKGSDFGSWALTSCGSLQNRGRETSLGSTSKVDPEEIDLLPWLVLIHPENSQELVGIESFSVNFPIELTILVAVSGSEVRTTPGCIVSDTIRGDLAKIGVCQAGSLSRKHLKSLVLSSGNGLVL